MEKLDHFPRGKPAATDRRYPAYIASDLGVNLQSYAFFRCRWFFDVRKAAAYGTSASVLSKETTFN